MRWSIWFCVCTCLLAGFPIPLSGQTCLNYEDYLQVTDLVNDAEDAYSCVALFGDHLYAGCEDQSLFIYDVSDAGDLVLVADLDTAPYSVSSICFVGDVAFMSASELGGILTYDVSDPTDPTSLGAVNFSGQATQLAMHGDVACVASDFSDSGALLLFDVSDPERPNLLASVPTAGRALTVATTEEYAYVGTGHPNHALQVFDISDPAAPVLVQTIALTTVVFDLEVVGDYLYFAGGVGDLWIYDITFPADPVRIGELEIIGVISYGVTVFGERAYLCQGESGGSLVDISDPTEPILLGTMQFLGGEGRKAIGRGDFVYASLGDHGLAAIDWAFVDTPSPVGCVALPAWYEGDGGLVIREDRAYLIGGSSFYIIDISDPFTPQILSRTEWWGETLHGIAVNEPHAYLVSRDFYFEMNLRVVDVNDPEFPVSVGICDEHVNGNTIHCMGDRLLQPSLGGLDVFNVSNPQSPTFESYFVLEELPYTTPKILVNGNIVFCAMYYSGLFSVDFSDLGTPMILMHLPEMERIASMERVEDLLYCLTWTDHIITVLDVSEPDEMIVLGSQALDISDYRDLAINESHAYVSSELGLHVFELGEPWEFTSMAVANFWEIAQVAEDGFLYTVLDGRFCSIYPQCDGPSAVDPETPASAATTLDAWPNPFNPHTTLTFSVTTSARLRLSIHDMSGRQVALLADRVFQRGRQEVVWRGEDDRGRSLASGVYLARLEQNGEMIARKLVLLR